MALPRNYINYFTVCKLEGIPTGTAKRATGKGLEGIAAIQKLKPIGHLFKEFEKGDMRKCYGILKSQYDYYKKTGKAPEVSPGRPPKWKDNPNLVNINIPIDKTLYEEFKAIIDKANSMSVMKYSYRDMFAVAVKEFCDRRAFLKLEVEKEKGDSNGGKGTGK